MVKKVFSLLLALCLITFPCAAAQQGTELRFCTAEVVYGISAVYKVQTDDVAELSVVFNDAVKDYAMANYEKGKLRIAVASADPLDLSDVLGVVTATLEDGTIVAPRLENESLKYNGKNADLLTCKDRNKDHACDVCGVPMGKHEVAKGKHTCRYCEQTMSSCVDGDQDHVCDICGAPVGAHEAAQGTHTCDYCGNSVTTCVDANTDNLCDVCQGDMGNTYEVTFFVNGGTSDPETQIVKHGGFAVRPNDPVREDYVLTDWTTDPEGETQWNFEEDAVIQATTLYAQWRRVLFEMQGRVYTYDGQVPESPVRIIVKQGNIVFAELETDENGCYALEHVPAGIYNIITEEQTGKTVTVKAEISANLTVAPIYLAENNVSSVLAVTEDTPLVIIGGLDKVAEDHAADGEGEEQPLITVSMTVEKQEDVTDEAGSGNKVADVQAAIKEEAGAADEERELLFLEIDLEKTEGDQKAEAITDVEQLLEIIIPFETQGRCAFKVHRHHGDEIQELMMIPNEDGEYFEIREDAIVVYAKKFSIYAVSSVLEQVEHVHQWNTPEYVWAADGCTEVRSCQGCDVLKKEAVSIQVTRNTISLSHVPGDLKLIIAGYTVDGQMVGCQFTDAAKNIPVSILGDAGKIDYLHLYCVDSGWRPLCQCLLSNQ